MIADTATRSQSNPEAQQRIEEDTLRRLERYAARPHEIPYRLREIDEEWDVERAIQANAAALALSGTLLSLSHDRRWVVLPLAVTGFLLQHALQGWCPPLPVLRKLGFRTQVEIERERHALKALRGDFGGLPAGGATPRERARAAMEAASRR